MGFKRNELVSVYEGVNEGCGCWGVYEGCGCISYLWVEWGVEGGGKVRVWVVLEVGDLGVRGCVRGGS